MADAFKYLYQSHLIMTIFAIFALMILTAVTMIAGVITLAMYKKNGKDHSGQLMMLRVGLQASIVIILFLLCAK